ncbi:hypothetical protein AB0M68_37180 [Streptomyces sp. NPDC051453]|uniref:hypothetical protein n=1 Tax=Streptomyces sp. NPDC051453 TaxID=3154941 RepID=UPI00343B879D
MTSARGDAIRAWSFNQHFWKKALVEAGVIPDPGGYDPKTKNILYGDTREHGFHCLRHTFASVQSDARESVVSVSKWLGHTDAAITLRVCARFMPEADGRGRHAMDAWLASSDSVPKRISLDSPWGSSLLPLGMDAKAVKFPRQTHHDGLFVRLNGASEAGRKRG